jgi:hypothetical protein
MVMQIYITIEGYPIFPALRASAQLPLKSLTHRTFIFMQSP